LMAAIGAPSLGRVPCASDWMPQVVQKRCLISSAVELVGRQVALAREQPEL